ncbi:MAG: hypothetical protein AWU57_62 [Marinobacter sp. T13-3]|nr:MAG: hypothetical protein AWU57_62 [Marinobacter sp. T13-3]
MGQSLIILPLGLAPIIFVVFWFVFFKGADAAEKYVNPKLRKGATEYPAEVSALWMRGLAGRMEFTDGGKSVTLNLTKTFQNVTTRSDLKATISTLLREHRVHSNEEVFEGWVDHIIIKNIIRDPDTNTYKVTLTVDDDLLNNEDYLAHEIRNVGRVHMENTTSNGARYLSFSRPNNSVRRENGRLLVTIERSQLTTGVIDSWKRVTMSERQITRNIENRLWNRYSVKCLSMDDSTYYGKIIGA